MKNIILFTVLLGCQFSFSQGAMVVTDPVATANIVTALQEARERLQALKDQTEFLRDAKEKLDKVNSKVREIKGYKRLIDTNTNAIRVVRDNMESIIRHPRLSSSEISKISYSYNMILDKASDNLSFAENILKSEWWSLSDYERIDLMNKKNEESEELLARAKGKIKRDKKRLEMKEFVYNANEMAKKSREKNY